MKNLKILREERGLSQTKLGELVGLSQSSIHSYEKGEYEPDIGLMKQFADIFSVSIDFLLGHTDIRTPVDTDEIRLAHRINKLGEPEISKAMLSIFDRIEELKAKIKDK